MKLSAIILAVSLGVGILVYANAELNYISAQNSTPLNNSNISNMTNSNMTSSNPSAKMHLEAGINALKGGDNQAGASHLDAAKQFMVPGEAMKHFDEGVKALENGDSSGAIKHLELADKALG